PRNCRRRLRPNAIAPGWAREGGARGGAEALPAPRARRPAGAELSRACRAGGTDATDPRGGPFRPEPPNAGTTPTFRAPRRPGRSLTASPKDPRCAKIVFATLRYAQPIRGFVWQADSRLQAIPPCGDLLALCSFRPPSPRRRWRRPRPRRSP